MERYANRPRLIAAAAGAAFASLVLVALAVTLRSLSTDEFDGLNNGLQIPLALPWLLVVPAPASHRADAYLTAAIGIVNAVLVAAVVLKVIQRRA